MPFGQYRGAIISYLEFRPEIYASIIRFVPKSWDSEPGFNWQLYGCNTTVTDDSGSGGCDFISLS